MKTMILALFVGLASLEAQPASALNEGSCDGSNEASCMLDAIWTAASVLPPDKQDRLARPFLETVSLSRDAALLRVWMARLGTPEPRRTSDTPYATQKAKVALAAGDWDAFLRDARAGVRPFNIGRPEIMAAGARMAPNAATRHRVIETMYELAGPRQQSSGLDRSFEQADFGYALAELSMEACDLAGFDRAVALTADPDSLRYALWRHRITGDAGALAVRIRSEADASDTHHVRTALEGYGPILQRGYCR
jgi:hypothetical protein